MHQLINGLVIAAGVIGTLLGPFGVRESWKMANDYSHTWVSRIAGMLLAIGAVVAVGTNVGWYSWYAIPAGMWAFFFGTSVALGSAQAIHDTQKTQTYAMRCTLSFYLMLGGIAVGVYAAIQGHASRCALLCVLALAQFVWVALRTGPVEEVRSENPS